MKDASRNVALLILTTILITIVAELGVRLAFPEWAPRTGRLADLWQFDANYGWSHVPGTDGPFRSFAFDTHVSINADGFRGPEIRPKDPKKVRVALIGDSYVFGYGVEYDETFGARLEALCPGLDVLNLGVSGYSTDQELLLFKERGVTYDPDIVILVMVDNDYEGNATSRAYVYYEKPAYTIVDGRLVLTNRPVHFPGLVTRMAAGVARHSYLLNQLNRTIQGLKSRARMAPAEASGSQRRPGLEKTFPSSPAESLTAMIVSDFVASVKSAGARLLIVMTEQQAGRARGVAEYLVGTQVPVIQLDDYMSPDDYERYRLNGDPHWNAAGHELVADAVLSRLFEDGLVDPATCRPLVQATGGN